MSFEVGELAAWCVADLGFGGRTVASQPGFDLDYAVYAWLYGRWHQAISDRVASQAVGREDFAAAAANEQAWALARTSLPALTAAVAALLGARAQESGAGSPQPQSAAPAGTRPGAGDNPRPGSGPLGPPPPSEPDAAAIAAMSPEQYAAARGEFVQPSSWREPTKISLSDRLTTGPRQRQ